MRRSVKVAFSTPLCALYANCKGSRRFDADNQLSANDSLHAQRTELRAADLKVFMFVAFGLGKWVQLLKWAKYGYVILSVCGRVALVSSAGRIPSLLCLLDLQVHGI